MQLSNTAHFFRSGRPRLAGLWYRASPVEQRGRLSLDGTPITRRPVLSTKSGTCRFRIGASVPISHADRKCPPGITPRAGFMHQKIRASSRLIVTPRRVHEVRRHAPAAFEPTRALSPTKVQSPRVPSSAHCPILATPTGMARPDHPRRVSLTDRSMKPCHGDLPLTIDLSRSNLTFTFCAVRSPT